jgi:hypothetical protein
MGHREVVWMHLMFPEATVCGRIHYVEVTVHIQSQIHTHTLTQRTRYLHKQQYYIT